jgi:hypothetical protein
MVHLDAGDFLERFGENLGLIGVCVGIVSDSTLTSIPRKGSAALMNHSISLSWSSFDSVEGWNSLSTQRLASSTPANPGTAKDIIAAKAMDAKRHFRIVFLPYLTFKL